MAIRTRILTPENESPIRALADSELPEELTSERLARLYLDEIWRYVSSHFRRREDAEDVTMEVFTAAITSIAKVRKARSPRLWLFAVARRKVADALRRKYRRREEPLDESIAGQASDADSRESLRQALAELPESQREVLVLRYVSELSHEEIGALVGKSPQAVNSLLQRGRDTLRERHPWLQGR